MEEFDVVVIGSGPGGYPAAIRAAQLGARTAIIEKESIGGTCLNWGCIPTKSLIASAEAFHEATHASELGINIKGASFDYKKMVSRKDAIVDKLRGGVNQLLKGNGVTVFQGTGSFKTKNQILINRDTKIKANKTIIATGSTTAQPGFLPKHDRIVDSRTFLELEALPSSLIVLGGGIIGCEFACMAAQLGASVTIVEMLDDILTMLDKDVRRAARQHMEKKLKIEIKTGLSIEDVLVKGKKVTGKVGDDTIEAEILLVATGRKPVTEGLELQNAGLETDETGHIPVDEYCQTRTSTVYAIGDVTGGPQLAHYATSQGLTAAHNACAKSLDKSETVVPSCIFTSPEIAGVGITEQQAQEREINVKIGKFPFSGLGKAAAIGDTTGFVKWIADAETEQIIGAHAIGPKATELIAEAAAAMRAELTLSEIGNTIHSHPTLSEAWMEAAHQAHGNCIHAAPKKKRK